MQGFAFLTWAFWYPRWDILAGYEPNALSVPIRLTSESLQLVVVDCCEHHVSTIKEKPRVVIDTAQRSDTEHTTVPTNFNFPVVSSTTQISDTIYTPASVSANGLHNASRWNTKTANGSRKMQATMPPVSTNGSHNASRWNNKTANGSRKRQATGPTLPSVNGRSQIGDYQKTKPPNGRFLSFMENRLHKILKQELPSQPDHQAGRVYQQLQIKKTTCVIDPSIKHPNMDDEDIISELIAKQISAPSSTPTTMSSFTIAKKTETRDEDDFKTGLRMSRSERKALTGKELLKARSFATAPLSRPFLNFLPKEGLDGLGEAYDLQVRTFQFKERLGAYDMLNVFNIMTAFDSDDYIIGDGAAINLFDRPSAVSISQVRRSNLFYRKYGPEDTVTQDLDWSATLLEDSSEQSLQNQFFERLVDVPSGERGGPLSFKIMMDIVTSVSPASIETTIQSLRKISLQDAAFPGEDVDRVNQRIRGTVSRLKMVDAVPKDIIRLVCLLYQTSSTPEFNATFQTLGTIFNMQNSSSISLDELLSKGEEEYRILNSCNAWGGMNRREMTKRSAFSASNSNAKCPTCGRSGDCEPADPGATRTAPKEGEPDKKTFRNRDGTFSDRMWCGKCGLWNKTHTTTNHRSKSELAAANATPSPSANTATLPHDNSPDNSRTIAAAHAAYAMMQGLLQPSPSDN